MSLKTDVITIGVILYLNFEKAENMLDEATYTGHLE